MRRCSPGQGPRLHIEHLTEWCPAALRFLGLPPGWRFSVANGYEDAWEDPSLLNVSTLVSRASSGSPVAREVRAMDDVEGATGVRPDFDPYSTADGK